MMTVADTENATQAKPVAEQEAEKAAVALAKRREKAVKLVAAAAVTLEVDQPNDVIASVQGSEEKPYEVVFDGKVWACDCQSTPNTKALPCKHVLAVQMVLEREARDATALEQVKPASAMVQPEQAAPVAVPMNVRIAHNLAKGGMGVYEPETFAFLGQMADYFGRFVGTDFVPTTLKSPEAVAACVFFGAEVGLSPMQALQDIYIVNGKPSLSAHAMLSLIGKDGDVTWRWLRLDETGAKLWMALKDGTAEATVEFTLKDAQRAGLMGKDNWKKYPEDMCASRCVSRAGRRVCPWKMRAIRYVPEEADFEGELTEAELPPAVPLGEVSGPPEPDAVEAEFTEENEFEGPSEEGSASRMLPEEDEAPPPDEPPPDLKDLEDFAPASNDDLKRGLHGLGVPEEYHKRIIRKACKAEGVAAGDWQAAWDGIIDRSTSGRLGEWIAEHEEAEQPEPEPEPEPEEQVPAPEEEPAPPREDWDFEGKAHLDQEGYIVLDLKKHKGERLTDVADADAQYLQWVIDNNFPDDLKAACQQELERQ